MKQIKKILKYVLTFPQVILHKGIGVDEKYDDLVTFFRYFPFAYISKDRNIHFFYNLKKVKFYYGSFRPICAGVFKNGDYSNLVVKDKVVVDFGSAYGDTPLLFVLNGAKNVIGFELDKNRYDMSVINIRQNSLGEQIKVEHCGIGLNKISETHPMLEAALTPDEIKNVSCANFKTFEQVVLENNISGAVLKIDVDGFEYEILRSANKKILQKFETIYMEYHYGIQDLKEILENSGFEVSITKVIDCEIAHLPIGLKKMEIGYISANRVI